jgi:hypothetical protein
LQLGDNQNSLGVPVAVDETALSELFKALVAGDTYGMLDMASRGRLGFAEQQAKARVLEYGFGFLGTAPRLRVRIESGRLIGFAGWIPPEWFTGGGLQVATASANERTRGQLTPTATVQASANRDGVLLDVAGASLDEAVQQLLADGVARESITVEQVFDETVPSGRAVGTSPSSGASHKGLDVTLYLSKGPKQTAIHSADVIPTPKPLAAAAPTSNRPATLVSRAVDTATSVPATRPTFTPIPDQVPLTYSGGPTVLMAGAHSKDFGLSGGDYKISWSTTGEFPDCRSISISLEARTSDGVIPLFDAGANTTDARHRGERAIQGVQANQYFLNTESGCTWTVTISRN